jgi:hypothetical protein
MILVELAFYRLVFNFELENWMCAFRIVLANMYASFFTPLTNQAHPKAAQIPYDAAFSRLQVIPKIGKRYMQLNYR